MSHEAIDAVIMWVDGEDPAFLSRYEHYAGIEKKARLKHEGKGRHRSTGELGYCLRGIAKNAPWFRKIYIVTSGQVPNFVDFDHPKIELVTHDDIFPDLTCLPTFNSFAIDSCLHRVPDLSQKFVRFSDDFIIINPVSPESFLGSHGDGVFYFGPYVPNLSKDEVPATNYLRNLAYNRALLLTRGIVAAHAPQHVPQIRDTAVCMQIEQEFAGEITATRQFKFRNDHNINMLFMYPHFVASRMSPEQDAQDRYIAPKSLIYYTWKDVRQAQVGHREKDWRDIIRKAVVDGATFLNVNDHFGNNPSDTDISDYHDLMSKILPKPAPFESRPPDQAGLV